MYNLVWRFFKQWREKLPLKTLATDYHRPFHYDFYANLYFKNACLQTLEGSLIPILQCPRAQRQLRDWPPQPKPEAMRLNYFRAKGISTKFSIGWNQYTPDRPTHLGPYQHEDVLQKVKHIIHALKASFMFPSTHKPCTKLVIMKRVLQMNPSQSPPTARAIAPLESASSH